MEEVTKCWKRRTNLIFGEGWTIHGGKHQYIALLSLLFLNTDVKAHDGPNGLNNINNQNVHYIFVHTKYIYLELALWCDNVHYILHHRPVTRSQHNRLQYCTGEYVEYRAKLD